MTDDDKQTALRELHDIMVRTAAMMTNMESLEHRVATVIEGGRQQLSHLVADLNLPEMRAELRRIKIEMTKIAARLE
jgi:hypothetical protein